MSGRAEYYVNDGYRNGSTLSFNDLKDDEDNIETLKPNANHQIENGRRAAPVPMSRIRVDMVDSTNDSKCLGGCSKPGFWLQRTLLEKFLFGLVLLCLIGFLTVVILLATNWTDQGRAKAKDGGKEEYEVCTTSGCVEAASNLLKSINASQDPCEDFYNYACGLWNRENPIPDDMPGYGTFSFVRERVRQQMRVLLETDQDEHQISNSIRMTRLSYKSCMNTTARDKLNSSALQQSLEELRYWPILHGNSWDAKQFDLTWLMAQGRKRYANEVFYSIYVYADAKNTSRNVLYIDQGQLALGRGSRDYYLNDTMFGHQMQAYTEFLHRIVEALAADAGFHLDLKEVEKNIGKLLEFEKQLANITVPEDDRRNHSRMYNKWTLRDLSASTTSLNWTLFFDQILPDEVKSYMTPDTVIIVCEPEYMHKIEAVLKNTDAQLLADYVLWRFVQGWVKMLDTKFDDIRQDFLRVMTGQQQKSALWKVCAPGPVNWMPLAAGSLYVREYFNTKDKNEALEMIGHLREAFTELVQKLDWMDHATRMTAVDKAQAMLNHIGYPDFIKDNQKLDEHYKSLDYNETHTYFEMVRKILVWTQEKELKRLLDSFDKTEFEVSPAIVNAFYSPEKNAITFPAGILQPPFFNGEYPKAVNYGAIGAVIGHEITHGFDDQGSQFDKNGNLNNWWSAEAFDGFQERTKCIIDQYSNYRVPEANLNVNGKLTQGENIADNGGVKEAFTAYRKYIEKLGKEEPRLPGLSHMSNNQIFFLSYAHFWCGHKKKEAAVQQILTDEHSPEVFRVIGVLSNLNEFSEAFKCKPNSKLNPVKTNNTKCTVW